MTEITSISEVNPYVQKISTKDGCTMEMCATHMNCKVGDVLQINIEVTDRDKIQDSVRRILSEKTFNKQECTIMQGQVYYSGEDGIAISCGGLLLQIPNGRFSKDSQVLVHVQKPVRTRKRKL